MDDNIPVARVFTLSDYPPSGTGKHYPLHLCPHTGERMLTGAELHYKNVFEQSLPEHLPSYGNTDAFLQVLHGKGNISQPCGMVRWLEEGSCLSFSDRGSDNNDYYVGVNDKLWITTIQLHLKQENPERHRPWHQDWKVDDIPVAPHFSSDATVQNYLVNSHLKDVASYELVRLDGRIPRHRRTCGTVYLVMRGRGYFGYERMGESNVEKITCETVIHAEAGVWHGFSGQLDLLAVRVPEKSDSFEAADADYTYPQ